MYDKTNKRWLVDDKILDDFDACSLYPSAMARLFTVEGKPKHMPKKVIGDTIYNEHYKPWVLYHAFTEDQLEPTKERFISYCIVDIEIVKGPVPFHITCRDIVNNDYFSLL